MRTAGFLLAVFCCIFQNGRAQAAAPAPDDSITISLITCYPGPEIYELCGHEAIRVRGAGVDSIWNYGTFDFNEPNFVYRFVKGETDYMLSSYPFEWFLPSYIRQGRRIVEQDLNLSQKEARRLYGMLQKEALPPYRTYRYNYVKDNCATRIIDRLDQAVDKEIVYPDTIIHTTFRNEMRSYHRNYPWYQFGIDLALGSGIDYKIRGREEMFVPVEMMNRVGNAHFADGRKLVSATRVINEGVADATLEATPWWQTPLFWSVAMLLVCAAIVTADLKRHRTNRWIYSAWFGLTGLAGLVVTFLVFVSQHEATSPNILLIWLNPLQLILAAGVWFRKMHYANLVMAYYNVAAVGMLLLVWAFQTQSANPAFFPLMVCNVTYGAAYIAINQNRRTDVRKSGTTGRNVRNNAKRKK